MASEDVSRKIVREFEEHSQNSLSRREKILPVLPSHHRNNQK